jgi:hypothetical protein
LFGAEYAGALSGSSIVLAGSAQKIAHDSLGHSKKMNESYLRVRRSAHVAAYAAVAAARTSG